MNSTPINQLSSETKVHNRPLWIDFEYREISTKIKSTLSRASSKTISSQNHVPPIFAFQAFTSNCSERCLLTHDFDNSTMLRTFVSDFDLVCDRLYLLPILTGVYMAGVRTNQNSSPTVLNIIHHVLTSRRWFFSTVSAEYSPTILDDEKWSCSWVPCTLSLPSLWSSSHHRTWESSSCVSSLVVPFMQVGPPSLSWLQNWPWNIVEACPVGF